MRLVKLGFMMATLLPTTVLANEELETAPGKVVIVGNGFASAAPEYAKLNILVTSKCYESAGAAKNNTAILANKLLKVMKSYTLAPTDKVNAVGGMTIRQDEIDWIDGNKNVICKNGWRSVSSVTLQTAAIKSVAEIQEKLILAIDAQGAATAAAPAITYANLDLPKFHLKAATEKELRQKAQTLAYEDAKAQADTFATRCGIKDLKLTKITPPSDSLMLKIGGQTMPSQQMQVPSTDTPIIPDEISVVSTWKFVWSFEPTFGCPMPL